MHVKTIKGPVDKVAAGPRAGKAWLRGRWPVIQPEGEGEGTEPQDGGEGIDSPPADADSLLVILLSPPNTPSTIKREKVSLATITSLGTEWRWLHCYQSNRRRGTFGGWGSTSYLCK